MRTKAKGKNLGSIFLLLLAVPIIALAFSTGPPAAVTGGFGEPTCNQAGCHTGTPVNGGPGTVSLTVPQLYTSGGTFPITVTVSDPNQQRWGFELSARTQNGQQAGNLIAGTDGFTQPPIVSNGIQYLRHTLAGTRNGTQVGVSFNFSWQAPNTSVGSVVFHVAANAANGDFNHTGDRIYTTSATSQPQQISDNRPAVNDGGVVNSASLAPAPTPVAPGSIAAIFGTNLNDGSSVVSSSFGSDGKLVTTLGGSEVTFNGIQAPLFFSTPNQLGVQVPTQLAGATSATVEVTVGTQTSSPRTVQLDSASPGIFSVNSSGAGQGTILNGIELNQGIFSLAAPSRSFANARPAEPGETIVIFCTGLGEVNPPVEAGVLASSLHNTVNAPTVTMDGLPATVQFSGLAPGFVGLYQVNAVVPAGTRSSNDIPVVLTVGGTESNTVTIAVYTDSGSPGPNDSDY